MQAEVEVFNHGVRQQGFSHHLQTLLGLDHIRAYVPDDSGLDAMEPLMAPLITMTAFDLGQDRLTCFASYRFLYERLIGANVRPWLPGAFCAAAAEATPNRW